jgi:alkylhydroperoxidase family enzyme
MSKFFYKQLSPPEGWRTIATPRLHSVIRRDAGFFSRLILLAVEKHAKLDVANLWLLLRINPRLLHGMLFYASKFIPFGKLKRMDTELVILRVSWNCRARYIWGQHVQLGMRAGLSSKDILRIADGPEGDGWNSKQEALLHACDEFHRSRFVSDSTWNILASLYNKKLLLELLLLIGFYEGLAGTLNSVGLQLEDSSESNLSALLRCK